MILSLNTDLLYEDITSDFTFLNNDYIHNLGYTVYKVSKGVAWITMSAQFKQDLELNKRYRIDLNTKYDLICGTGVTDTSSGDGFSESTYPNIVRLNRDFLCFYAITGNTSGHWFNINMSFVF